MIIAHDFNKSLFMYKLRENYKNRIIKDFRDLVFIDIDKVNTKKKFEEIDVYWGNRLNIKNLSKMKNLQWVHLGSSGIEINLKKNILSRNIKLTNSKNILIKPMVSSIIAYIFALSRGLHYATFLKNKKKFDRTNFDKFFPYLNDVYDSKILILGLGSIGKELARKLSPFTSEIYAIKKKTKVTLPCIKRTYSLTSLVKIIHKMEIIINILPLNDQTHNIFNSDIFNKMKNNSIFINVGRGETVNEKDLYNAIKNKKIGSVGLDVFDRELNYINVNQPIKQSSKLFKLENLLMTPHVSNLTNTYWNEELKLFSLNLKKFNKNIKLINLIN